jgi:hypothetical protein
MGSDERLKRQKDLRSRLADSISLHTGRELITIGPGHALRYMISAYMRPIARPPQPSSHRVASNGDQAYC